MAHSVDKSENSNAMPYAPCALRLNPNSAFPIPNLCPLTSVLRHLFSVLLTPKHLPISNRQNASLNRYREHNADAAGNGADAADDSGDGG